MRLTIFTTSILIACYVVAYASSQDDLHFARTLFPNRCLDRLLTVDELEHLKALVGYDMRDHDNVKGQASYWSKQALHCQDVLLKRQQQEEEAKLLKAKQSAALAGSPECRSAYQASVGLDALTLLPEMLSTARLANAGDTNSACQQIRSIGDKLETARAALVICFKSLRGGEDGADSLKDDALNKATSMKEFESALASDVATYKCSP